MILAGNLIWRAVCRAGKDVAVAGVRGETGRCSAEVNTVLMESADRCKGELMCSTAEVRGFGFV